MSQLQAVWTLPRLSRALGFSGVGFLSGLSLVQLGVRTNYAIEWRAVIGRIVAVIGIFVAAMVIAPDAPYLPLLITILCFAIVYNFAIIYLLVRRRLYSALGVGFVLETVTVLAGW